MVKMIKIRHCSDCPSVSICAENGLSCSLAENLEYPLNPGDPGFRYEDVVFRYLPDYPQLFTNKIPDWCPLRKEAVILEIEE